MTMTAPHSVARVLRKGLRATWSVLWMFTVTFGLAIALTLLVKEMFGDFDHFKAWQESHFAYLLMWRILVYALLAVGWLSIRRRVDLSNDPSRLIRCEILLVSLVCLFEVNHAGLLQEGTSP